MSDPRLEAIRKRLDMPTSHPHTYYTLREDIADLLAIINTRTEALQAIQSQCAGHADEFSGRVWRLAEDALK